MANLKPSKAITNSLILLNEIKQKLNSPMSISPKRKTPT